MLSKVKIGNFKSIEELELQLAPLTIFVGPNSSGKSNVLENIAILAQTTRLESSITRSLEGSLRHGAFIQYPISRDFPLFDFIAYKKDWSKFITFEIHITDVEYHDIGYHRCSVKEDCGMHYVIFKFALKS